MIPVYQATEYFLPVIPDMQETGCGGVLSVIGAVTLEPNINLRTAHKKLILGESYPEIVICIILAAFKVLNNMARMDLASLQKFSEEYQTQLYHVMQLLLAYCTAHYEDARPVRLLLNEMLLFIGKERN